MASDSQRTQSNSQDSLMEMSANGGVVGPGLHARTSCAKGRATGSETGTCARACQSIGHSVTRVKFAIWRDRWNHRADVARLGLLGYLPVDHNAYRPTKHDHDNHQGKHCPTF